MVFEPDAPAIEVVWAVGVEMVHRALAARAPLAVIERSFMYMKGGWGWKGRGGIQSSFMGVHF